MGSGAPTHTYALQRRDFSPRPWPRGRGFSHLWPQERGWSPGTFTTQQGSCPLQVHPISASVQATQQSSPFLYVRRWKWMQNLWFRQTHIYDLQIPARHSTTHLSLCHGQCMFPGPLPPAIVPHHLHSSQTPSKSLFLVISADNFIHKYRREKTTFKDINT